jgi:hypothetical protein
VAEPKRNDCLSTVEKLYERYKDNEYMLQRIYNHVHVYLPNTLAHEEKNHEKRQNLNSYLSEEQQIFMQVFLSKNNYYYLSSNNFYYEYNGIDYFIVKEDEILHKLLSTISKERTLLQWKYKTKAAIIKQIKERNLFTSIPETDTIQNVLNYIYPSKWINIISSIRTDKLSIIHSDELYYETGFGEKYRGTISEINKILPILLKGII